MKKFNKSMTSLAIATSMMALTSNPVFAATNPKDVIAEINKGNWNQAETLIQQVLKEQPGSAKAWYYRSQIETQLAKNSPYHSNQELTYIQSALASLNKAKSLDNTLSFAQNPSNVAKLESQLKSAESTVKTAQASMQQNVQKTNTAVVHQAPSAAIVKPEQHSSGGMGIFGAVLIAVGLLAAGGFFFIKRKEKNTLKDELSDIKVSMVRLTDDIKAYKEDLEFQNKENSLQYSQASSLWDEIVSELANVDNVERIPAYRNRLETYNSRFKQIKNGSFNVVRETQIQKEQEEYAESRRQKESSSRVNSDFSKPSSRSHREQRNYDRERREQEREDDYRRNQQYNNNQPPQTTIINNGSNGGGFGDMLTGMAIGSMLSGGHHDHNTTTIIERESPRDPSPSNSDFDSGNGGNNWGTPVQNESIFDGGSNDGWENKSKDEPFDFGNNFNSSADFSNNNDDFDVGNNNDDEW